MGHAEIIFGVGIRDLCRTKGITIDIYFSNQQNADFTGINCGIHLVCEFYNQPSDVLYIEISLNGRALYNSRVSNPMAREKFVN